MSELAGRLCSIYRCSKKEGMYLYVDKTDGLEVIPDNLHKQIGSTELAMSLLITEDKKLARANAADVLAAIAEKGFYLQMPPSLHDLQNDRANEEMNDVREKNSKL